MIRVRAVFLEPIWGIVFFFLPWILMSPILFTHVFNNSVKISLLGYEGFFNHYVFYICSSLFLSLTGFISSRLINELNLFSKENYLIALVIAVLGAVLLCFSNFSNVCISCFTYFIGLFWLCKSPKEGKLDRQIFNAGFFFFLGVIVDLRFIIIAPLNVVLLLLLRSISFRTILVFLSSFLVIVLVIQQVYFLFFESFLSLESIFSAHLNEENHLELGQSQVLIAFIVLQTLLLLGSFPRLLSLVSNRVKSTLRMFLYSTALMALLFFLDFLSQGFFEHSIYTLPFLAILVTINLMFTRSKVLLIIHFISILFFLLVFFFKLI